MFHCLDLTVTPVKIHLNSIYLRFVNHIAINCLQFATNLLPQHYNIACDHPFRSSIKLSNLLSNQFEYIFFLLSVCVCVYKRHNNKFNKFTIIPKPSHQPAMLGSSLTIRTNSIFLNIVWVADG